MGTNSDDKILTPFMASGIFLDDSSSGTTIYGNVFSGIGTGALTFSNGKDNVFENNIFWMNRAPSQITVLRHNDFMQNNSFKHNIVICNNENGRIWQVVGNKWDAKILVECDWNPA
jgi:parallel beta-helix repeat protein